MRQQKNPNHKTPLYESLSICRLMVKYALLFGIFINILMLAPPIYSMQVLDRVISSGNKNTLLFLTIVIVFGLSLLALLQGARAIVILKMGEWLEKQLSEKLFTHSLRAQLNGMPGGGDQQLRDLTKIKSYLTSPHFINILDLPWAILFIIVLFLIHPYMGFLAIIGGAILVLVGAISNKVMKPLNDQRDESYIASMQSINQASRNAEVIRVMGMLPSVISNWQHLNKDVQKSQNTVGIKQSTFGELSKFIRMILQIAGTCVGAFLVLQNEISVGAIIAGSSITSRALAPFDALIASWRLMLDCRKAYDRLQTNLANYEEEPSNISLPAPNGSIRAENLFFQPHGVMKHVIKGVSFVVEPGETLVILGPSASGKTTLAKLMVGVHDPQIGCIRLDNANLADWNKEELGQHMGYLPQDIELFSGDVKQNIARMDRDADSADIIEAAKIAGAHDMILELANGYETQIGPDGCAVSGGQRQRIALARALYKGPKLIVLDEPNSNLDNFGEMALSQSLMNLKERGVTSIIISHRTSVLQVSDKVMVLRDGSIAMFGPRDEVLSKMSQAQSSAAANNLSKKT